MGDEVKAVGGEVAQRGDYVQIPEWYCTDSARGEGWGSRGDECEFCERYMFDGTENATEDAWAEHYIEDHGFRVRMSEAEIAAALSTPPAQSPAPTAPTDAAGGERGGL